MRLPAHLDHKMEEKFSLIANGNCSVNIRTLFRLPAPVHPAVGLGNGAVLRVFLMGTEKLPLGERVSKQVPARMLIGIWTRHQERYSREPKDD